MTGTVASEPLELSSGPGPALPRGKAKNALRMSKRETQSRLSHRLFVDPTVFVITSDSTAFVTFPAAVFCTLAGRCFARVDGAEDLCTFGVPTRASTATWGAAEVSGGELNRYPNRPLRSSIWSNSLVASTCAAAFFLENGLEKNGSFGFVCSTVPFAFSIFSGQAVFPPNHDFFTGMCNSEPFDLSTLRGDGESGSDLLGLESEPNMPFLTAFSSVALEAGCSSCGAFFNRVPITNPTNSSTDTPTATTPRYEDDAGGSVKGRCARFEAPPAEGSFESKRDSLGASLGAAAFAWASLAFLSAATLSDATLAAAAVAADIEGTPSVEFCSLSSAC